MLAPDSPRRWPSAFPGPLVVRISFPSPSHACFSNMSRSIYLFAQRGAYGHSGAARLQQRKHGRSPSLEIRSRTRYKRLGVRYALRTGDDRPTPAPAPAAPSSMRPKPSISEGDGPLTALKSFFLPRGFPESVTGGPACDLVWPAARRAAEAETAPCAGTCCRSG